MVYSSAGITQLMGGLELGNSTVNVASSTKYSDQPEVTLTGNHEAKKTLERAERLSAEINDKGHVMQTHAGDLLFQASLADRPTRDPTRDQPGNDHVTIQPVMNGMNLSIGSSCFMDESAAMRQLEKDEKEFEESNMFRLKDASNYSSCNASNEITLNDNYDPNISQFFRNSSDSLGLDSIKSPKKDEFQKPIVPIQYGGASETFDVIPNTRKGLLYYESL